jgi:enoyl-CoA hydratase/carnithine racemase
MADPSTTGRWEHLDVSRAGGVTEIALHSAGRPLVWNATVHRELPELWAALHFDADTRVVILTGCGDAFCTEIDGVSFKDVGWDRIWWEGRHLLGGLLDLDVPVITAVNGPAWIHSELAVMADIVLACEEASFADKAHVLRGHVPADGVHLVWRSLLGPTRSSHFLLTGVELDAAEALRLGVVHELIPRRHLLDRAREHAAALAALPLVTLRATRTALRSADRHQFIESLSHGLAVEALASRTSKDDTR